jgi:chloramphenicol-sensitive protein RarD
MDRRAVGLAYAFGAFFAWGIAPIYFKAVKSVPALEVASHRALWSMLLLCGLVVVGKRLPQLRALISQPRLLGICAVTTVLITGNWLLFIWAVNEGRMLEASLGYFINPLVNVLLGVLFFKESLNRPQLAAVILAGIGVLLLVFAHGHLPIVSLSLAVSFGLYGLIRKKFQLDPVVGLLVETSLLTPFALGFLVWKASGGEGAFGTGGATITLLLIASGVVTAVPLVWFTEGAQRLRLSTLGLMQYIAPTGQFLLAVLVYGEPFTRTHAVTFAFIWASLAIYSADALLSARRQRQALALATGVSEH